MSLSRRDLLKLSAAAALGGIQVATVAAQPRAGAKAPARFVVVLLRGGMDGLSMVVPHGDAGYYQARSTIALPRPGEADGLLPLDRMFGLHPAMAPLHPFWESRQLAFVHASGSPDPTRSHFDAQDFMESGVPGNKSAPGGWLNRLAGVLAGPNATPASQRMHALNLGPTMPRIFSGPALVTSMDSLRGASKLADGSRTAEAFARLYQGQDDLSRNVQEAAQARMEAQDKLASDDPKADIGGIPLPALARSTAQLGQLMAREPRVRLAFVPVAGWDTHASQGASKGALATRFGLLAQALEALTTELGEGLQDTTILVLSEFGRTVKQNGNNGTDHGHGNVAMLLGGGVRGGKVHGEWPGLEAPALYQGRDLAITTDFRDIVADVLEQRFRLGDAELARVLPQMPRRKAVGLFV